MGKKRKHAAAEDTAPAAAATPAAKQQKVVAPGSNWAALSKSIGAGKSKTAQRAQETKSHKPSTSAPSKTAPGQVESSGDYSLTKVIALDCEMVGTGPQGRQSVLARVTVVNSFGNAIYDTHVAVKENVTDYRTHVSGIHWYDLKDAPTFEEVQAKVAAILKGRILVGHTLKSDMTALMLSHPKKDTRDLALYAPLCRGGKAPRGRELGGPMNNNRRGGRPKGLKVLAAEVLGLEIQTGEHSPVEDARASMYVYLRYRKSWEKERVMHGHGDGGAHKKEKKEKKGKKRVRPE